MGLETGNPGKIAAAAYQVDPTNVDVPDTDHHEFTMGVTAHEIQQLKDVNDDLTNDVLPVLPTADQKAALDGNALLDAGDPVAAMSNITAMASASTVRYNFRTAVDAPASGEIKLNNADPTAATQVRVHNLDANGVNIGLILLKLGDNDAVRIQDLDEIAKTYLFDVSGDPVQTGGTGAAGYIDIPVTFYSQGATPLADSDPSAVNLFYDGNNTRYLQKSSNLSDVDSASAARTNLSVSSNAEITSLLDIRNLKSANLGDVASVSGARTNLGVYATGEVDSALALKANLTGSTFTGNVAIDRSASPAPAFLSIDGGANQDCLIYFQENGSGRWIVYGNTDSSDDFMIDSGSGIGNVLHLDYLTGVATFSKGMVKVEGASSPQFRVSDTDGATNHKQAAFWAEGSHIYLGSINDAGDANVPIMDATRSTSPAFTISDIAWSAPFSMGTNKITGMGDPDALQDAATLNSLGITHTNSNVGTAASTTLAEVTLAIPNIANFDAIGGSAEIDVFIGLSDTLGSGSAHTGSFSLKRKKGSSTIHASGNCNADILTVGVYAFANANAFDGTSTSYVSIDFGSGTNGIELSYKKVDDDTISLRARRADHGSIASLQISATGCVFK